MGMFQKILVAYDGSTHSQRALKKAADWAKTDNDIHVHVVHVAEPPPMNIYGLYGPELSKVVIQEREEQARKVISGAKKIIKAEKLDCHIERLQGDPAEQILNYAKNKQMDLIMIGSRGLGGFKGMLLGSVSQRVIQHAKCHVLVIK